MVIIPTIIHPMPPPIPFLPHPSSVVSITPSPPPPSSPSLTVCCERTPANVSPPSHRWRPPSIPTRLRYGPSWRGRRPSRSRQEETEPRVSKRDPVSTASEDTPVAAGVVVSLGATSERDAAIAVAPFFPRIRRCRRGRILSSSWFPAAVSGEEAIVGAGRSSYLCGW